MSELRDVLDGRARREADYVEGVTVRREGRFWWVSVHSGSGTAEIRAAVRDAGVRYRAEMHVLLGNVGASGNAIGAEYVIEGLAR